jgi:hypothetical protein
VNIGKIRRRKEKKGVLTRKQDCGTLGIEGIRRGWWWCELDPLRV